MEFMLGVIVGGLMVGGIITAKVLANKAEANATPSTYLTGKGRIPDKPLPDGVWDEDGPVTGGHGEGL